MQRYSDWEARLGAYLDRVEEEPFKWGSHDCALFVSGCIKAQTGIDPGEVFRGKYDSAHGAAQVLRDVGAGTLFKTVKEWLGEPKSPHFAKRGDIVMLDAKTCGVCVGQYVWFVGTEQGLERLAIIPTSNCRYAFSIPFDAEDNSITKMEG